MEKTPISDTMQMTLGLKLASLADVHTGKRGRRERTGVHAWHPYYAGYAEQFVADTLSILAEPGDLVLDPWNGSGTTTRYFAESLRGHATAFQRVRMGA